MSFQIGALILAAGQSSRFGHNKLLEPLAGKVMVRHVAEAAVASLLEPIFVVTGNEGDEIRSALDGLPIRFCDNPDYPL